MIVSRAGIGLPAVLVVLAVSAVASLGLVAVGLRRGLDAQDAAKWVRVHAAAESAVRTSIAHWDADALRALPPGASAVVAGASRPPAAGLTQSASVERVGPERFLVRGEAAVDRGGVVGANASALATVVMVPTDPIWRDFYAALASRGGVFLARGASLSGMDSGIPMGWGSGDCPPGLAATITALLGSMDRPGIATAAGAPAVSATGASVAGLPPIWAGAPRTDTADFSRLGSLPLQDVAVIADLVEAGTVHLAPVSLSGRCRIGTAGNWGHPTDPADPCFGFVPLIHAPSDLEIGSGGGQGILVVDGNLVLRAGVRFTGLILTRGRVELDGASVTGAIRAGAGARIDGSVSWSSCALGRILDRASALRKPYRFGARLWLPAF